ncbi:hypothetical protein [Lysobacter sp. CA199]|uniref:hypothetical protein n=1 Tax=Lysobacter sp. CA199 TaxID=3455608 RepID=UPI003F8D5E63
MSIVIVQGAHPDSAPLGAEFYAGLRRLAAQMGRRLEVRPCASLREFVAQLRAARTRRAEFVLIDPGELAPQTLAEPDAVRQALDDLPSAYIEVHDRSATTLDERLRAHALPMATIVINGDLAASYRIALGIALRRLGRGRSVLTTIPGIGLRAATSVAPHGGTAPPELACPGTPDPVRDTATPRSTPATARTATRRR